MEEIPQKRCNRCGIMKYLTEFYRHPTGADGYTSGCKECLRANMRRYSKTEGRRLAHERYRKSGKGRVTQAAAAKAWSHRNPETRAIYTKVYRAVKSGKLLKQPCEVCGADRVEAHHDDYSRPLDVRWLCKRHHEDLHTGDRNG